MLWSIILRNRLKGVYAIARSEWVKAIKHLVKCRVYVAHNYMPARSRSNNEVTTKLDASVSLLSEIRWLFVNPANTQHYYNVASELWYGAVYNVHTTLLRCLVEKRTIS